MAGEEPPRANGRSFRKGKASSPSSFFLPVALCTAVLARVLTALAVPPASDVYYYLTEASRVLLQGLNPYDHAYASVPAALVTPGAAHVFAYLPFTAVYLIPFYLLGDVRVGMIFADLVVGLSIYFFCDRLRRAATLLFLLLPFTILFSTVYVNAALVAVAFAALALSLEKRGRGLLGAVCLGLAIASIQFAVLLLPLFGAYYFRSGRRARELVVAIAVALAVAAPFLIASPAAFLQEVVSFQFARQPLPFYSKGGPFGFVLNPSLGALALSSLGQPVLLCVKFTAEVILITLLTISVRDIGSLVRNAALLVLVSSFVLPNDFFWAYLEFPYVLLLCWLGSSKSLFSFWSKNPWFLTLKG